MSGKQKANQIFCRSWYAIIKIPGMNCGNVIICVNNFVDLIDYRLRVTYPKTHSFYCVGDVGGVT